MYASRRTSSAEATVVNRAGTRFSRSAARLSLLIIVLGFLVAASGVRIGLLPEPVRIDRGTRVDVYAWESVVAAMLMAVGGLGVALTTDVDRSAAPGSMLFRRTAKWTGWIAAVGGLLVAGRLAFMLLGLASFP
jgi:hypothetical protein